MATNRTLVTANDIQDCVDIAQKTIGAVAARLGKGQCGGYLVSCEEDDVCLASLWFNRVGMPEEKHKKSYAKNAVEKAHRLALHPNHQLSRQSRDPGKGMYGGGVRFPRVGRIMAFSGLPEEVDEGLVIGIGYSIEWLTWRDVEALFKLSGSDVGPMVARTVFNNR